MTRRLVPIAALAVVVAQTVGSSAAAPTTLDGQTRTSHSYSGTLAGPTWYDGLLAQDGTLRPEPSRDWCKQGVTCDSTEVFLQLPRGRQSGRLVIDLTYDATAQMHLGVYDSKGVEVQPQDSVGMGDRLVAAQLPKGRYTVVVYDDAGQGGFKTLISWKANRPHRTASPDRG